MIAKRVPRDKGTSSPARLVRYMVAAVGGIDPNTWSRTPDYVLDTQESTIKGEKIASYRVVNCSTDDPAAATVLIEATQAANSISKKDKTYHLVFSFPSGENRPLGILHAIEDELCASIGYANHHRISAVHKDTDHLHVHVAINKIHPTGYQNREPYYDKKRLMQACERLEIKHGLQRTHHGLTKEKKNDRSPLTDSKTADIEAKSGIETLTGYIARVLGSSLCEAKSWGEVHEAAAKYGLEVNRRGAGLVIGDPSLSLWTKASHCSRNLSLKALTDRLGPFKPSDIRERKAPHAKKAYRPKPKQPGPSSAALFS